MPHPRILKELGMTPAQWGQLPVESESPIRNELKEKAANAIMAREKSFRVTSSNIDALKNALLDRIVALESRVQVLESEKAAMDEMLNAAATREEQPV